MNQENLKKYAEQGLNVLLSGKHGVGKTHIVKDIFAECFGDYYTNWRYFSASTLDPWVDFIGIPKNYQRQDGKEVFGIVPPEHFTGEEEIKAVFFDEINRADEKTLNALMELIQFKSINGRKYPNLKCVWAAENPADDYENNYSVRDLDPAQKDRFHVQINVPFEINTKYFEKHFDKEMVRIAKKWWKKNQTKISPRKLEHLLFAYQHNLPLQDFSNECNVKELQKSLSSVGKIEEMKSVLSTRDNEAIKSYFTVENLRKNANVLSEQSDVVRSIYKSVDEETQNYILEEFDYSPKKPSISSLEGKPKQLIENLLSTDSIVTNSGVYTCANGKAFFEATKTNPGAYKVFSQYIDFIKKSTPIAPTDIARDFFEPNFDYSKYLDSVFPFTFSRQMTTYHIEFFIRMMDENQEGDSFIRFALISLLLFKNSKQKNVVRDSNLYKVIRRFLKCEYTYSLEEYKQRFIAVNGSTDLYRVNFVKPMRSKMTRLIEDLGHTPSKASDEITNKRIINDLINSV